MSKNIIIIYVPGIGDTNLKGRQRALKLWRYRNVSVQICRMRWKDDEPWVNKLGRLSSLIRSLASENTSITLVGESAGASAVTQALVANPNYVDGVVLLCGKSQYPELLGNAYTSRNPALKTAVTASAAAIAKLTPDQKSRILNLHPIFDPIVPVKETKIPGVKNSAIPMIGHVTSIAFTVLVWSWKIVAFARKRAKIS